MKTKNMNLQLFAGEITDLTGTSWVLNDHIDYSPSGWRLDGDDGYSSIISISFNSGYYFDSIRFADSDMDPYAITYLGSSILPVYRVSSGWVSDDYRSLSIVGGTGAKNSTLISWFQSNATQIQTGYSSTITLTNCTCNKLSESGLSGSYTATITADEGYYLSPSSITCSDLTAVITPIGENKKQATISIAELTNNFTINAEASAVTVLDVVLHPNNNGEVDYTIDLFPQTTSATTLDINRMFEEEYTITATVINGRANGDESIWSGETASVTITPDPDHDLPSSSSVIITNATGDFTNWNDGVIELSNAVGNVTINATCESAAINVTITFQNCDGYIGPYLVFDTIDHTSYEVDYFSSEHQIGSLSNVSGTINIVTTTGKIYIIPKVDGVTSYGTITPSPTRTFGRAYVDNTLYSNDCGFEFTLTTDETIVIDGFGWDD